MIHYQSLTDLSMRKMCFLRKIAFDQFDLIDATDLSLCRRIKNAWVVDKKISWTYTQVYIEHNEILLCIYSVVVNDPKVTLNDLRRIHYRDMIGWYTFDSHWFKNRERAPIFVQSERGISLSLHWHQLFSFLPILRVINLCPRRITLETFIFSPTPFLQLSKFFTLFCTFKIFRPKINFKFTRTSLAPYRLISKFLPNFHFFY